MRLIVYRAPSYKSLALGTTRRICFTTRLADETKQGTANEQAAQAEREEAERAIYNSKQMRHFQAAMSNPVIKPYHQKRTPFQTKEKRRLIDQIRESRDQERSGESDGKTETGVEEVKLNSSKKIKDCLYYLPSKLLPGQVFPDWLISKHIFISF